MFAHISFDNIQFSQMYIAEMFKEIGESDFIHVKRYERPILQLIQIADGY